MAERRLRVLHVVKGLGPGGAERLLCAAAAERDSAAFDYDVAYVLPWKDHVVPQLVEHGVSVHCVGRGSGRLRPMLDPRWPVRLRALTKSGQYDVVHVHSPLVAGVTRPLVHSLGRHRPGLVSTEHNGWRTFAWPTRAVNRMTYGLDDLSLAVSEEVRSSVAPHLRDRVEVVIHGIRVDVVRSLQGERSSVRSELGVEDDDVVVGTVANFRPQKAYPDLLAAARAALDVEPRLRFVAVGQGPEEQEVRALHRRLGLGDRFRLLGYREDAERVLAGCDVFALASHYEGLPVALMEALALGLPVTATAVGGIPDAVTDGREGLLVAPKQPAQLADAFLRLAKDDMLRATMSAAAAERAAHYDIRRAVRRMEVVYHELAAARAAAVAK